LILGAYTTMSKLEILHKFEGWIIGPWMHVLLTLTKNTVNPSRIRFFEVFSGMEGVNDFIDVYKWIWRFTGNGTFGGAYLMCFVCLWAPQNVPLTRIHFIWIFWVPSDFITLQMKWNSFSFEFYFICIEMKRNFISLRGQDTRRAAHRINSMISLFKKRAEKNQHFF